MPEKQTRSSSEAPDPLQMAPEHTKSPSKCCCKSKDRYEYDIMRMRVTSAMNFERCQDIDLSRDEDRARTQMRSLSTTSAILSSVVARYSSTSKSSVILVNCSTSSPYLHKGSKRYQTSPIRQHYHYNFLKPTQWSFPMLPPPPRHQRAASTTAHRTINMTSATATTTITTMRTYHPLPP